MTTRPEPGRACCLWCRKEDSTWFLAQNHGGGMGLMQGLCMAQYLRFNQLHYAVAHDTEPGLRRAIDNALDVWPDPERISDLLALAYARLARLTAPAPAHHEVPDSEQGCLL